MTRIKQLRWQLGDRMATRHPVILSSCHLVILSSCLVLSAVGPNLLAQGAGREPADLSQLRGITGIEEVPPAPPPVLWPYWLPLSIMVGGGLLFAGWKWTQRRARSTSPPLPPDLWALAELDWLGAMKLAEGCEGEGLTAWLQQV